MKAILVPTDFSITADNAARYAMHLAREMHTNLELCNAIKIPIEALAAAQVVWPLEDYSAIKNSVTEELSFLSEKLELEDRAITGPQSYHPIASYTSEIGSVNDVVRNIVDEQKTNLVVMGMPGMSGLSRLVLGSSSRDMIDIASFPILLVPSNTPFKKINKIAFATDLSKGDIEVIHSLASFAYYFNAEILIAHITDEKFEKKTEQKKIDAFLSEVTSKANYPKIYYRHVKSIDVDHGLDWLSEHGLIDMLAMVHRPHHFLSKLINGSHTQKMATHITIPLLVFPPEYSGAI